MDGCVADFAKGMSKIAPHILLGDGDDYEERSKLVHQACLSTPDIFHNLEPIEGGVDSVKELMKYYEVFFLSTPMDSLVESYTGKKIWINNHFGEHGANRLILSPRKDLNLGDYLVDDTLRNGVLDFKGEHIHFGTKDFPNWNIVFEYLITKI